MIEHVDDLLDGFDGRTVITSDHGNLLGERLIPLIGPRAYGHPQCRRHLILITVPWAVSEEGRRNIVDDGVASQSTAGDAEVSRRLRALSYAE